MSMSTRPVRFSPLALDGIGDPSTARGFYLIAPTSGYALTGMGGVDQQPVRVDITTVAVTIDLPVTGASWVLKSIGSMADGPEYVAVPAGDPAVTVNYEDLVRVDLRTLQPAPAALAGWTAVLASVASGVAAAAGSASSAAATLAGAAPRTAKYLTTPVVGDNTAAIQAVIDSAGADDIVRIVGTYTIASTVFIKGNFDGSGAVFNYTGNGTAVQVGDTSPTVYRAWKSVHLPRIICLTKPSPGVWNVGTVGVFVTNVYTWTITLSHITSFETGLYVKGQGAGVAYCVFIGGQFDSNKVNQKLESHPTGWVNQNTFIGGQYSHNSAEGTQVSGARHVQIVFNTSDLSKPNNNTWLGPSLEGDIVEYEIDCNGVYNEWYNARFEAYSSGMPKVRWGAVSVGNRVVRGYGAQNITETHVSGSSYNAIDSIQSSRSFSFGEATTVMENTAAGGTFPMMTLMPPGGIVAGANPATGYVGRFTANYWSGKRTGDAFDRVRIDAQNGRVYIGNGTADPISYWYSTGNAMELASGSDLLFGADNVQDIGYSTSLRPRSIRAATTIITGSGATASRPAATISGNRGTGAGAMFYDTTLGKPIWSDGTVWRDAMGTAV